MLTITQNEGYVLSELKVDGNAVTTALSYTVTNVQKDTTITASFSPISYTISYNLDGGTASNPTSYTVETESFTLNQPTKDGYTFKGWTGSNGTTAQTSVTIAKGSTGDKSYTANWELANIAPTIPTVTTSNKTTNSFTVSAVATDVDGDNLTYRLYVGGSLKETKTESSGTQITFDIVSGLSEYTTYSYYVTVTDGTKMVTSSTGSIRTKCSGTQYNRCSGITYATCSNCDGAGELNCKGTIEGKKYTEVISCISCSGKKTMERYYYGCTECSMWAFPYVCNNCGRWYCGAGSSDSSAITNVSSEKEFKEYHSKYSINTCETCSGSGNDTSKYYCSSHKATLTSETQFHCSHGYSSTHN